MQEIITTSEAETETAGENFARELPGGTVVAMYGDLGAGKTAFVRRIPSARPAAGRRDGRKHRLKIG